MSEHTTRFGLRDGMDLAGIEPGELWWHYSAIGGAGSEAWLAGAVHGTAPCPDDEHDLIAQALNEAFLDRGVSTFPVGYARADSQRSTARSRVVGRTQNTGRPPGES